MARAKQTDRADARRRWRQTHGDEFLADDSETVAAGAVQPPASAPSARPSITAAFRNAYHPANVREDLAALPGLLGSRAFLVALALVVGGLGAVVVAPNTTVSNFIFQAMVVPPAMAPIFIVGFFARRASYLLGLIIALVDFAAYAFFVYSVAPGLTVEIIEPAQQQQLVLSALSVGPLSGVFFAAAAAWYRRFLSLSNANAQRRAQQRAQQRARSAKSARR
ncbi:MAG: hypothetical protein HW391_926 [Chloroflexi bacterium]|nr:hypothetical protein [Chloroflexota bacterium]